jgi:beta-xylosidase
MTTAPWRDPALTASARVDDLLSRMTLQEKTAQLYGVWVGASTDGDGVAPLQREMTADYDWDELITRGLGQLTRPFGTAPVDPGGGGGGGGGGGEGGRGGGGGGGEGGWV